MREQNRPPPPPPEDGATPRAAGQRENSDGVRDGGYTPASPAKRALAWTGIAYVLLFLGLSTYFYYTGTMLGGLAPLLVLPGLVGAGAVILLRRRETGRPARPVALALTGFFWLLALVTLPLAAAGFLSNFGG